MVIKKFNQNLLNSKKPLYQKKAANDIPIKIDRFWIYNLEHQKKLPFGQPNPLIEDELREFVSKI